MKKIFLSVVFLLTVTFAFALNNVEKASSISLEEAIESVKSMETTSANYLLVSDNSVEDFGTCTLTLTFYNADGEVIGGGTLVINDVGSAAECDAIGDAIEDAINN
ncbi:MAG: hypothetical protein JXR05_14165 [Flavobacteriaceae bacterium]